MASVEEGDPGTAPPPIASHRHEPPCQFHQQGSGQHAAPVWEVDRSPWRPLPRGRLQFVSVHQHPRRRAHALREMIFVAGVACLGKRQRSPVFLLGPKWPSIRVRKDCHASPTHVLP